MKANGAFLFFSIHLMPLHIFESMVRHQASTKRCGSHAANTARDEAAENRDI
jgi:hypothetical protein